MKQFRFVELCEDDFEGVYEILQASFPAAERRTYDGQKKLIHNPDYRLYGTKNAEGTLLAFIGAWETEDFVFIEHFAVASGLRGKNIGKDMLSELMQKSQKNIVLEVEVPYDELSKRRVGFYERLGFTYTDYGYYPPALQKGFTPPQMRLMTWPKDITADEFAYYKKWLFLHVYLASECM